MNAQFILNFNVETVYKSMAIFLIVKETEFIYYKLIVWYLVRSNKSESFNNLKRLYLITNKDNY